MRHILVTGGTGQVGMEVARLKWPEGFTVHFPARSALDLESCESVVSRLAEREWAGVINCAAYTAVDKAEIEVGAAFLANAQGPAWLAQETHAKGIPLIHVSTDYVFDGTKAGPYVEDDPVRPIGVYGASKLAGELAVRTGNPRSVVLRTAWVLSAHRTNFLKTMLRVGATNPRMRVVADQLGCPTSASDIAETLRAIVVRLIGDHEAPTGIYHFVNAGEASWFELAREIFVLSKSEGGPFADVEAISTADYPTPARRPKNSRLSTAQLTADFGIIPRPWREAVQNIVIELLGPVGPEEN